MIHDCFTVGGGRVPFESLESFLFFPSCHRGWLGQFGRCSWMTKSSDQKALALLSLYR